MRPQPPAAASMRPAWAAALCALREAVGVTQAGWAAWLRHNRMTIQRWKRGEVAPDTTAEVVLLA